MDKDEARRLYGILKKIEFMSQLSLNELGDLVDHLQKCNFKKGDVVVRHGDPGDSFFLLAAGKVAIWGRDRNGKKVQFGFLGPEQYFGEMALLTGEPRSATIICEEPTQAYLLTKTDFDITVRNNPTIVQEMMRTVERRRAQGRVMASRTDGAEPPAPSFFGRLKAFLNLGG